MEYIGRGRNEVLADDRPGALRQLLWCDAIGKPTQLDQNVVRQREALLGGADLELAMERIRDVPNLDHL